MPTTPIDPLSGPGYVLEGRLVTMGAQGVLSQGAIYIKGGVIRHVLDADADAPPGFEDAPRIRTGDTIYPGLIELHNHLCYNAMPLWDVPRRYENNNQWKGGDDYQRRITKPSQVLGRTEGVVEALVRYVEARCLLGGSTTSQGITLYSADGIEKYYQGIVRNVEQTEDPESLPQAGTRIANPDTGGAQAYLETLRGHTCYLQHLSEGVNETARRWFHRLQLPNGDWAVTDAFCGIHSTALTLDDFQIVADHGGSMVWSPLSNYLLYGDTVDLEAAKESGILMGIGSDWSPSGSKNVLGELKVAWLANLAQGRVLEPEDLVKMATVNAAKILKWEGQLGSIEPDKRADLVAINGQQGDDYLRLLEARETSITLVVIDGVPRLGQTRLMAPFGPGTEEINVGRSKRVLNLAQETAHPLVANLTLAEAMRRLRHAMANLPALATDLDNALAAGLFTGSVDASGTAWRIVMDFDVEEPPLELGAQPLAAFVEPMLLPGITVADEPEFLRELHMARNLPDFIRQGLPPLYGEDPLPESAHFLREAPNLPPEVLSTARELRSFLHTYNRLGLAERTTIVDQALVLLEQNYVHLPLKRAMYAVDPIQALRLLRHRQEEADPDDLPPDAEFHAELTHIFNSVRDLHTAYRLPTPFREATAWLPFQVEAYGPPDHPQYLVTRIVGNPGPDTFQAGVELLYWNGVPIHQAVLQNAERQAGGNPAARWAQGLNSLAIRPLASCLPPDEEHVTLQYRTEDGEVHEATYAWLVFDPLGSLTTADPSSTTALALDMRTDDIQEAKKLLYAGEVVREERAALRARVTRAAIAPARIVNASGALPTELPTFFRAMPVDTRYGRFAYIRIFSFNHNEPDGFVAEFVRLLEQLPQDGLIVDVRGNGGGLITAAEQLLQVLTPRAIEPQRAQFVTTPLNLRLCRLYHDPRPMFPSLRLRAWTRSISEAVQTGATYSHGYPISDREACNAIGQRYYGPVVLIVDALCYSATDIFAAGFQDHKIGLVLGTSANTGAGGANVWTHGLLRRLMHAAGEDATSPYEPLPQGADLQVAVRRTLRVGEQAGDVLEDMGVRPNQVLPLTRRDLLEGNVDLIEQAASYLAPQRSYGLAVAIEPEAGATSRVRVQARNATRLDVLVDGRPGGSLPVVGDQVSFDLSDVTDLRPPFVLELVAHDGDWPVARRLEQVTAD